MELFHNLIYGFGVALSLQNLLYCFIGCMVGTLIGVLPGIGPLATIAMLLPLTYNVPPVGALIMLPLSLVLFGQLMAHAGFIPALVVLVFASAASGGRFKLIEILVLTAVLTVAAVVLFIWGLGLPYPLIKGL